MLKKILTNGYIPIIPILIWNLIFIDDLPTAFKPESFNADIPVVILIGENVFRIIIFILPLIFTIRLKSRLQKIGLLVFSTGTILYIGSWLLLMLTPDSHWSTSLYGFTAPAYTPLIWLTGLGLMVDKYYFKLKYSVWHYTMPAILFSIMHIAHTVLVFLRTY